MSYEIGIQIEKLARRKSHAPVLHLLAGLFLLLKGADFWRYNDFKSWLSVSPFFLVGLISILYGLLHKKLDPLHKAQPYLRGFQILCFSILAFQFITTAHELDGLFSMVWAFICFYFFLMEKRMYESVKLRIEDGGISLPGMFGRRQLDWAQLENMVVRADYLTIFFSEDRYLQYTVLDTLNEAELLEISEFVNSRLAAKSGFRLLNDLYELCALMHARTMLKSSPYLLYSDGKGNIFEDKTLYVTGRTGWDAVEIPAEEWIELPDGGSLYELPGRKGIGIDVKTGEMRLCEKGWAVAAFLPPAHTGFYLAAYETALDAPTLPLFCYTTAGWFNEKFYVPAIRVEPDIRQECAGYDSKLVETGAHNLLKAYPQNRLVKHLMENCALTYTCPAARNFALGRWECPVPSSPACNANCVGCISFQPEEETIVSTQDRLTFRPSAEEIVEFTVPHLETAPFPIVSFGQGCEGEPLLMWETIRDAIIEIRKHTNKGSLNINTNGSRPDAVEALCKVGLDSIRVSTNSARREIYMPYYRPNNYEFEDIIESLQIVTKYGGWTSINYFVFPGMTDSEAEYEALRKIIRQTGLKMIQWRNFNIDPDWYLGKIGAMDQGELLGVSQLMQLLREEFPDLKYGYFNPPIERIRGDYERDFAH